MPRRNLLILAAVAIFSVLCYQKVQRNHYGRVVADAMEEIQRNYVKPVEADALFEGAMDGMVGRLGDPYSAYIAPRNLPKFNELIDREFGGVGMELELDPKTRQLTVVGPLVGTPAHREGIRPGDKILRIDGDSTQGMSLEDVIDRLRGMPGEPVTLTVLHEGDEKPVEIRLVREKIHVDTVLGDRHNPDGSWNFHLEGHPEIAYVRVNSFAKDTVEELQRALRQLEDQGMKGLVLDLRDDPGGLLEAAIGTCDLFIDSGTIVSTRGREGKVHERWEARPGGSFTAFPIAVLVNRYSASASEIVAACLQDHKRAVVVGERTWGKGTVQDVIDLPEDAGALRLTIATYWRPSGKNINRDPDKETWGVEPDEGYRVPSPEGEALERLQTFRHRRDVYHPDGNGPPSDGDLLSVDPQLAKAVEYIEKQAEPK